MADFKTGDDPADHTVEEVVYWLDQADDTERGRVLEAEAAGKNRVSLAGYTAPEAAAAEAEAPAAMTPEEALTAASEAVQAKAQASIAGTTEE